MLKTFFVFCCLAFVNFAYAKPLLVLNDSSQISVDVTYEHACALQYDHNNPSPPPATIYENVLHIELGKSYNKTPDLACGDGESLVFGIKSVVAKNASGNVIATSHYDNSSSPYGNSSGTPPTKIQSNCGLGLSSGFVTTIRVILDPDDENIIICNREGGSYGTGS
jgi:hypothetical protein